MVANGLKFLQGKQRLYHTRSETEMLNQGQTGRVRGVRLLQRRGDISALSWSGSLGPPHGAPSPGPSTPSSGTGGTGDVQCPGRAGDRVGEQGNQTGCRAVGADAPPGSVLSPRPLQDPVASDPGGAPASPARSTPTPGDPGRVLLVHVQNHGLTPHPGWPPSTRPLQAACLAGAPRGLGVREFCPGLPPGTACPLTLQVHLVQLSTTQVSFSAKNRPSCQQADMFLVLGGPPMSSQRNWLSFDWRMEERTSEWTDEAVQPSRSATAHTKLPSLNRLPSESGLPVSWEMNLLAFKTSQWRPCSP